MPASLQHLATLLFAPLVAWVLGACPLPSQGQGQRQGEGQEKQQQGGNNPPARTETKPPAKVEPATDARAKPKTAAEDELKSAFILQFARYVEWAEATARRGDAPRKVATLTIAVVGDESLGDTMTTVLKDKKVDERPIVITNLGPFVKLSDKAAIKNCDVLVFAGDDEADWTAIRDELGKASVLTVSTMPGFAKAGGMIELYPDGKSLRFEVVQRPLTDVGLSASSKLLRLSQPRPIPKEK